MTDPRPSRIPPESRPSTHGDPYESAMQLYFVHHDGEPDSLTIMTEETWHEDLGIVTRAREISLPAEITEALTQVMKIYWTRIAMEGNVTTENWTRERPYIPSTLGGRHRI
jgi:hypothetical protein